MSKQGGGVAFEAGSTGNAESGGGHSVYRLETDTKDIRIVLVFTADRRLFSCFSLRTALRPADRVQKLHRSQRHMGQSMGRHGAFCTIFPFAAVHDYFKKHAVS